MHTHQTTGTDTRAAHPLSGQGLTYSLDRERQELANDLDPAGAGRTAKTLAKTDTLRVTMVHLRAGTTVNPSATAGAATIQLLEGRLKLETDGKPTEMRAGDLAVFSDNLRDPLQAMDDSTFLLTVAWDEGAGAWDVEEREARH
jgi:quercetin dioxygenase-like cupin family protein